MMTYIVNTSFMVDPPVHGRWYEFLLGQVIPHIVREGFAEPLFTRVLTDAAHGHYTYSLQVQVPDTAQYQRFVRDILGEYTRLAGELFEGGAVHFTSLLKKIEWR